MADDWEDNWGDEDVDLAVPVRGMKSKFWQEEDEEGSVKDNWDDEDEGEKTGGNVMPIVPDAIPKKKAGKRLEDKITVKKMETKGNQDEDMTAEEKLAEKLRMDKLVKDADFENAMNTFSVPSVGGIDAADPSTREQFEELRKNICHKVRSLSTKDLFNGFVEGLVLNLCAGLDVQVLKKISTSTKSLHEEKLKTAKAVPKNVKKVKTKPSLKMDKKDSHDYEDYGDF